MTCQRLFCQYPFKRNHYVSFTLFNLIDPDECESGPCQNSGTCIDGAFSFHCECELFTGDLCQDGKPGILAC